MTTAFAPEQTPVLATALGLYHYLVLSPEHEVLKDDWLLAPSEAALRWHTASWVSGNNEIKVVGFVGVAR